MDQKISQFTTALTVNGPDLFPLVQDGANKAITAGNLANKLAILSGTSGEFSEIASSAINVATATLVVVSGTNNSFTGTPTNGKLLRLFSVVDGTTVSVPNGVGFNKLTLNAGGACILRNHATYGWFVEGKNALCTSEIVLM